MAYLQLAFVLLLADPALGGYEATPYPVCTDSEYFDTSALSCLSCPAGQSPSTSGYDCICSGTPSNDVSKPPQTSRDPHRQPRRLC